MALETLLPLMLGLAWLLPLASFALILLFGPLMGRAGKYAAHLATAAIVTSCVLSWSALALWMWNHPPGGGHGHGGHAVAPIAGDWYVLGVFGSLRVTVSYYIDTLTLAMFSMVTLVASCIHFYSAGYMHGELTDVIDELAPMSDGRPMRRKGRYYRFFQYLSLFCFSMLGLVFAGNAAMVFVFWELVGICSYLLIGFWRERKSASNAANKAFIVNRVGDFGMIIGLMALWGSLGTFSFSEIFEQVRPAATEHQLQIPNGMVKAAAANEVGEIIRHSDLDCPLFDNYNSRKAFEHLSEADKSKLNPTGLVAASKISSTCVNDWRNKGYGYWLLVIAGLGIFCGCIGKSAQFPLHVWLPDAMEGPTPVSALIHAATMVAAGVYLVGRFYPAFTPEVLLIIACVGCITLFMAATIALTATDIKRVLAYSTVSQLGFMILALGLGGWLAGMFHLFTHAFFKSLLFLCSGSVIHACGTNEMPQMGGLKRKMPYTSMTMLIGCLAIAGAGIPTVIGLSGFHSKDYIMAQAFSFWNVHPGIGGIFFIAALVGAGMTAFYMFRLWYMTFAGTPRDKDVYHHAHESPSVMVIPLVVLAFFAIVVAWNIPFTHIGLDPLLRQSEPAGIGEGISGGQLWPAVTMPAEHLAHVGSTCTIAEWAAFIAAFLGFGFATMMYGVRVLDPKDAARSFAPIYRFLLHKWWFDELYQFLFVRPVLRISGWVAAIDKRGIDWLADGSAKLVELVARIDDWFDRIFIDWTVNAVARWTYALGLRLRVLQTGNIRQYVLWIAAGAVGLFVLSTLALAN